METQSRWKSYVMWAAVAAQLVIIMDAVGLWGVIGVERTVALAVVEAILGMLVLFGVLNNPTSKNSF